MSVESRLKHVCFDRYDLPPAAGVEGFSQVFLINGMRPDVATIVTKAQQIDSCIVFGYRREARHVFLSLVAVEGVEQSTIDYRLKLASQTLQLQCIGRSEFYSDPTFVSLRLRECKRSFSYINAENLQSQ